MKEIKMDFAEYDAMVKTIQRQKAEIEEFEKQENVVIIDSRYCNSYSNDRITVPRVTAGEKMAKKMLQAEFDELFIKVTEILKRNDELAEEYRKYKNLPWWKKIFEK